MTEANQGAESQAAAKQPAQVKNSTVLCVLFFVIVPWVLLALPGYFDGSLDLKKDQIESVSVHRKFGWPLTHKTESKTQVMGIWRGGQFRTNDPVPADKMDNIMSTHLENHKTAGGFGALNLVPSAAKGQSLAALWTDSSSYPTEIRKYVEDNVIEKGMTQTWNTPMLIANIVLLLAAVLGVGYFLESRGK